MTSSLDTDAIRRADDALRQYLRDRGLKYTPERRAILLEVLGSEGHFEAEQLLISLRESGKRIAKATIYRTLPLLVAAGIIKQVQFGDNFARYEHTFGQAPHDHMVCRRCGRVFEFDSADVARLRNGIAERYRFFAQSHRFQILGLCSQCLENCPAAERDAVSETDTAPQSTSRQEE